MGGWTGIGKDTIAWDGCLIADCFEGDGSKLTNVPSVAYNDLTGNPSDRITAGTNLSWAGDTLNASGGGSVSFGADNQIPSTNAATDDFDYGTVYIDGNYLGIGEATPLYSVHVVKDIVDNSSSTVDYIIRSDLNVTGNATAILPTTNIYATSDFEDDFNTTGAVNIAVPAVFGDVKNKRTVTQNHNFTFTSYGSRGNSGDTSDVDGTAQYRANCYGGYYTATAGPKPDNAAATVIANAYGFHASATTGNINTASDSYTANAYGAYMVAQTAWNHEADTTNVYGLFIQAKEIYATGDNAYGIWVDKVQADNMYGLVLDQDSAGGDVIMGEGQDSSLLYDGTDVVLDTALVGSGVLKFANASNWTANGTANVTISNVAPAGVGTATISKWLTLKDNAGTVYYIPAWT